MLDDLFITGDAANKALEELQKSTTMKLSMDDNGKVSATQQGTMMKGSDFELLNVINDSSVIVKVDATEIPYANGVFTVGGSAMETKIITNGGGYRITEANQRVVPSVLSKMSEANGKPGADMKHEVTEGYLRGVTSKMSGNPLPPATDNQPDYKVPHSQASPQSGKVDKEFYDSNGNITNDINKANQVKFYTYSNGTTPVIIMIYP